MVYGGFSFFQNWFVGLQIYSVFLFFFFQLLPFLLAPPTTCLDASTFPPLISFILLSLRFSCCCLLSFIFFHFHVCSLTSFFYFLSLVLFPAAIPSFNYKFPFFVVNSCIKVKFFFDIIFLIVFSSFVC